MSEVIEHPVMVQFVNLLRGIYESKDVAAMTVAVQVAGQVLLSPGFQTPAYVIGDPAPPIESLIKDGQP